jgi:hypothetical protein
MSNTKHSKFKNTAIIFELLSRQLTSDVLSGKQNESLSIIRKYFKEGTELHKELELYHTLIESKKMKEHLASALLRIINKKRESLNEEKLNSEKYKLIGELKRKYDLKTFFDVRIENYKTLASIYKIFETKKPEASRDYIENYAIIIESMSSDAPKLSKIVSPLETQSEDVKKLAFKLLIEKFNRKYKNLNAKQKTLISKFITENTEQKAFKEYVYSEVQYIQNALNVLRKRTTDKSLSIKLNEIIQLSNEITIAKRLEDNHISSMIKYYELIDNLKSQKV